MPAGIPARLTALPLEDTDEIFTSPETTPVQYSNASPRCTMVAPAGQVFSTSPRQARSSSVPVSSPAQKAMARRRSGVMA